jgi:uncharacterized membrane protein
MSLTPPGVVHTLLSLVAVVAALVALVREGGVSRRSGVGRVYIWSLVATCLTGLPIFRHGTIGPPHIAGVLKPACRRARPSSRAPTRESSRSSISDCWSCS